MGRLNDRVAIITGAGSGMGRACAILFANEGAKVAVVDCADKEAEETVEIIKEAGAEAIFVKTDVTKTEDIKSMIKETVDAYGKLDILVNAAGVVEKEGSILECPEETFDKVISVNLKGVWLGMKYAIPEMLKAGGGSIINFASITAFRAYPEMGAYCASKGGVVAMSRAPAIEFAAKNIRVNCVAPGSISTPMLRSFWPEDVLKDFAYSVIPQKRLGEPEEVARVVLFLASDESSHLTGVAIPVDGGMNAKNP